MILGLIAIKALIIPDMQCLNSLSSATLAPPQWQCAFRSFK